MTALYAAIGALSFVLALWRLRGDEEMPPPHRFAFAVGVGVCWPVVLVGELYLNWWKERAWRKSRGH